MQNVTRFHLVAERNALHAHCLAVAFASAHQWSDVFAAIRALAKVSEVLGEWFNAGHVSGYIEGCHFDGIDTEDEYSLGGLRDEAHAFLGGTDDDRSFVTSEDPDLAFTLANFIANNAEDASVQDYANELRALSVGESVFCGIVNIRRVS